MEGQQFVRFPKEVTRFLTGDYTASDEVVMPLFRELSEEEEMEFRRHARANYVVGDPISDVYHPIWRDEAETMNIEAASAWTGPSEPKESCGHCGKKFGPDDMGSQVLAGLWLCDQCWDNHDPKHPLPLPD